MRKWVVVALAALLVVGAAGVIGCGGTSVTVTTPGGKVNVNEKNGEVNVQTPQGNVSVSSKLPTEAELGVPIYPNVKMDENAYGDWANTKVAVLWTTDSPDKVIAWYKGKLSTKPGYRELMSTSDQAMLVTQAGDQFKMVTIGKNTVDHPGATSINISASTTSPPQ